MITTQNNAVIQHHPLSCMPRVWPQALQMAATGESPLSLLCAVSGWTMAPLAVSAHNDTHGARGNKDVEIWACWVTHQCV